MDGQSERRMDLFPPSVPGSVMLGKNVKGESK